MKYEKKTLANGLRVIAVPMANTETVTVLALIGAGSHYENRKNNGVSHFLEHMFFKGTKKYPNAEILNKRLDAIGAQHNAFTSKEDTGYWVKAHNKHFPLAFGFVADILQNALILAEEVERERNVIFEEMKMLWDTPRIHIWEVFERLLYGDQAAGWDIIGTADTLKTLKRKELVSYWRRQYVASNTAVIVTGNMPSEKIFAFAEKSFRRLRNGNAKKRAPFKRVKKGPRAEVCNKQTDQANLVFGVRGFPYEHRDRFTAEVLAMILGGYMSSRLFIKIRERKGLAYSVTANHQAYSMSGYLAVYAGIPHSAYTEVPRYIVEEFERIKKKSVTKEELSRAKEHIRGRQAIALESTDDVASFFGTQEILPGRVQTPEEIMKKIDKITRRDIQRVARRIFTPLNYYIACIGKDLDAKKLTQALIVNMR